MSLSFSALIPEFKEYLISLGGEYSQEALDGETNASIFLNYNAEFKEFLAQEHQVDFSNLSLDLSELQEFEIDEGQFVLPELDESQEGENNDQNLAIEVLNELMSDEEFSKFLDENSDGNLSQEEILNFASFLANYDENNDTNEITFDEVLKGFDAVLKGEYQFAADENIDETIYDSSVDTPDSVGSEGGYYNNGGYDNTGGNPTDPPQEPVQLNANSSLADLETGRNDQAALVSGCYDTLKTSEQSYQEKLNEQQELFNAALEAENELSQDEKDMILTYSNKIYEKKQEVSDTKEKIADYETQISGLESSLSVLNSAIESCNPALGIIPAPPEDGSEDPYAGKRQTLNNMIQAYKEQVVQLEQQIDDKNELRDQELENLKLKEDELKEIEEESDEKTKYDEFLAKLNQDTNSDFSKKAQEVKDLESQIVQNENAVEQAEFCLAEIEGFIKEKIKTDTQKLASSPDSKIFADNPITYTAVNMSRNTALDYGVLIPEGADRSQPMPVMIFLHGMGEYKSVDGAGRVIEADLTQHGLDGFNGYVIYPTIPDGEWIGRGEQIEEIINDFASQYNIDPDNIVLSGHSLGGSGAVDMAQDSRFSDGVDYDLKKTAAFAAYNKNVSENHLPIALYGDYGAKTKIDSYILPKMDVTEGGQDTYAYHSGNHGLTDDWAFEQDADGDGRSDLIEWLFDVDE